MRVTTSRIRGRRGAAMIEFVVVMPFLALILGLTFFFGYAMKNQQRVLTAARYQAWRHVWRWHGCGCEWCKQYWDRPHPTLNEVFFDDVAGSVGTGGAGGPMESLEELVDSTSEYGATTYELADHLIFGEDDQEGWDGHVARWIGSSVSASFPSDIHLFEKFSGSIRAKCVREGAEWRRGQINYLEPVRDLFLQDLDDQILSIQHERLRENLRRLYLKRW